MDGWMALVAAVKAAFPGLETPEALAAHRSTVSEFIDRREAVCAVVNDRVAGALLFSRQKMSCAFSPSCRSSAGGISRKAWFL